ncbi:MAG: hypothetical protein V2I65_02230 [Paracoccaceae bacterium]|jgi:hypothetical protein|nr:hypothetical protein [Paracoccaceae bacterium]
MDDSDIRTRILAFARHCGSEEDEAEAFARHRGWIDADGTPRQEGRDLIEALDEQEATRSVFRGVP